MSLEDLEYTIECPHGICLIVNNDHFSGTRLRDRNGSKKDVTALTEVFGKFLGFEIWLKENITQHEFYEVLQELRELNHSKYSAFIIILLSHGSRDQIYMCNGCAIPISCIEETFKATACRTLVGKPKVAIIQACQGDGTMVAVDVHTNSCTSLAATGDKESTQMYDENTDDSTDEANENSHDTIPDKTDFLFAYATTTGYKAFRDPEEGSWFIQQLCKTLRANAHKDHLVDILTMVTNQVSSMEYHGEAELPAIKSCLRKKLYIHPVYLGMPRHEMVPRQMSTLSLPNLCVLTFTTCSIQASSLSIDAADPDICRSVESGEYWHTKSSPRGYCIIVDNTDKWKEVGEDGCVSQRCQASKQASHYLIEKSHTTMFLEQKFGKELGLHVQTYLGLTHKVLKCLFEAVASLDHGDYECFVLIVLSKGKDKVVYDVQSDATPISSLLEYFNDRKCPSLAGKPKLFLFHTFTTTSPADLLNSEERIDGYLPDDSLVMFSNETETERRTSLLQSLLDIDHRDMLHINTIEDNLKEEHGTPLVKDTLNRNFNIYKIQVHYQSTENLGKTKMLELEMLLKVLHKNRENTITELRARQQKLKDMTRKVRISRIVGSSVGCIGGCVAVAGLALVPVTFGGSLAITVAGGAVAAIGGLASFGASATSIYITRKQTKKASNIISLETQLSMMISKLEEELKQLIPMEPLNEQGNPRENIIWSILRGGQGVARLAIYSSRGAGLGSAIGRVGLTGGALAAKVGTTAVRGVAVIGAAAAVITIPIDSLELGYTARQLRKKKLTKAEKWLQEHINSLERAQEETAKLLQPQQTSL